MGRLTQDHRQTKEGQGSNPNRLPIPKLSVNNLFMYAEPAVVYQDGELEAVIPNRDVWYNFFRSTKTNSSDLVEVSANASLLLDVDYSGVEFSDNGTITWLVYDFPNREIDRVFLEMVDTPGRANTIGYFFDAVELKVSPDNTNWTTIENNERTNLPSPTDKLYFRIENVSEASTRYVIRALDFGGDPEPFFEEPVRLSLR